MKATWMFLLKITTASPLLDVSVLSHPLSEAWAAEPPFRVSPSSSWGVCFTYGTWFGLEAFACMGQIYRDG